MWGLLWSRDSYGLLPPMKAQSQTLSLQWPRLLRVECVNHSCSTGGTEEEAWRLI